MKNRCLIISLRYNVGLYSDNTYGISDPDEWMDHRDYLFKNTALPSLVHQTNQDYLCLIFMDPRTPTFYIDSVRSCIPSQNFKVVLAQGKEDQIAHVRSHAYRPILISTRIDNDDAWHEKYVDLIYSRCFRINWLYQFFPCYYLDLQNRRIYCYNWTWKRAFRPKITNSPIAVEFANKCKTVLCAPHPKLFREFSRWRFSQFRDGYFRLIVCHEKNKMNTVSGYISNEKDEVDYQILEKFNVFDYGKLPAY